MKKFPFGPREAPEDPFLARAAGLPQDIPPPRDLWPGIAAQLGHRPARPAPRVMGWPMALAATVLVASVSALLTWSLMRDEATVPTAAAPAADPLLVPVNYGSRSALTAAEIAARNELHAKFREKFADLKPRTRATILKNLAVIQTAANEIDAALAQDPASRMLNELLVGAYKRELELYSMVVTADDGVTRRT
jgi:hypothetical protein